MYSEVIQDNLNNVMGCVCEKGTRCTWCGYKYKETRPHVYDPEEQTPFSRDNPILVSCPWLGLSTKMSLFKKDMI